MRALVLKGVPRLVVVRPDDVHLAQQLHLRGALRVQVVEERHRVPLPPPVHLCWVRVAGVDKCARPNIGSPKHITPSRPRHTTHLPVPARVLHRGIGRRRLGRSHGRARGRGGPHHRGGRRGVGDCREGRDAPGDAAGRLAEARQRGPWKLEAHRCDHDQRSRAQPQGRMRMLPQCHGAVRLLAPLIVLLVAFTTTRGDGRGPIPIARRSINLSQGRDCDADTPTTDPMYSNSRRAQQPASNNGATDYTPHLSVVGRVGSQSQ